MPNKVFCALFLVFIMVLPGIAADWSVIPRGGLSSPTGKTGETWQPGYDVELDFTCNCCSEHRLGARFGFHRWKPDAEELLMVNGRDFAVEQSHGWLAIGEVSGLVDYHLIDLPKGLGSVWAEGGLGAFYVRQPDVLVKGVCEQGSAALVHTVTFEHNMEFSPGISVGLSMIIIDRIKPMVRYQHIFTSGDATSLFSVGLGLMAR